MFCIGSPDLIHLTAKRLHAYINFFLFPLSFRLWHLFLCVCVCVCVCVCHTVMSDSLEPQGLQLTRLLSPWNSPGKNTGVGSRSLFHGIFLAQGWNSGLPHYRSDSFQKISDTMQHPSLAYFTQHNALKFDTYYHNPIFNWI